MVTTFDEAQHPLERDTPFLPGVERGQRSRVVDEKENHRPLARGRRGGSAFARWRGARLERESEQDGQHFGGSILHPAPRFAARATAIIAGMKAGILGLSLVGKSTLFQLLTGNAGPGHGGRPEARLGVARVPDPRVDALGDIFNPKKRTWATVEYVDVPGVSRGEGAALVDLPALRGVDALVHVVRAFESDLVPHPEGSIDPLRDASTLELELILADLGTVERRIERLAASIQKAKLPEDVAERELFLRLKDALEAEKPLARAGPERATSDIACAATRCCPRSRFCSSRTSTSIARAAPTPTSTPPASPSSLVARRWHCAPSPPRSKRRWPSSPPRTPAPSAGTWDSPSPVSTG